jgi:hypothetical protein
MFAYSDNGGQGTDGNNQIYRSDNTLANNPGGITEECNELAYNPNVFSPPTAAPLPTSYTVLASTAVEAAVLAGAGAWPIARDAVDVRVLAEMVARSSDVTYAGNPSGFGGYPTLASTTVALSTPVSPNADDDGDGYTNLEEWSHGYALVVEGGGSDPPGPDDVARAAGTVVVSDTFTDTDGTPLTSHTPETGGTWVNQATGVLEVTANGRLMGVDTAEGALHVNMATPLSANYDVKVDVRVLTLIGGNSYSIWARTSTTAFTGYAAAYEPGALTWTFFKFVEGAYTGLGACTMALSTATTYEVVIRMREDSKHLVIDDTQCASTDDNEITAAGKAGLSIYHAVADTESTGIHFDNFVVTDIDVLPPVTPPSNSKSRLRVVRR